MKPANPSLACIVALVAAVSVHPAGAQVVINEFQYDDTGTSDDREFIELYNAGPAAVEIGGWELGGRDIAGLNSSVTITPGTSLPSGGYYVIGNPGVLNVNQVVASGFLKNENETIELSNGGIVIDALAYETNKGIGFAAPVSAEVGPTGIFGNHQGADLGGTPLNATVSIGRFVDGRDTNNNGRDFGVRPSTPGTTNSPGGFMSSFQLPDPSGAANGSTLATTAGSFVNATVVSPGTVTVFNPNAIALPRGASKAYVAWDSTGGGNNVTSRAVFNSAQAGFALQVYLDTRPLPLQTNGGGVEFTGSEVTIYGIGSGDALTNLTDLTGAVGISAATPPVSESANGFTGFAWVYEKTSIRTGGTAATQKLHLVDANDGGDSDVGGNAPLDWTILASYTLPETSSGDWHDLSIQIQPDGNGIAMFDGLATPFTHSGFHSGAFNVGYRENLQIGSDLTPDAIMRPATFTIVPEPGCAVLLFMGGVGLLRRRRRIRKSFELRILTRTAPMRSGGKRVPAVVCPDCD